MSAGDPPGWYNSYFGMQGPMGPPGPPGYFSDHQNIIAEQVNCKELTMNGVNMNVLMEQLATMIPIFIPPDIPEMSNEAIKTAHKEYMEARQKLLVARDNLDLLLKLVQQNNK
jgi:hypothetical protein